MSFEFNSRRFFKLQNILRVFKLFLDIARYQLFISVEGAGGIKFLFKWFHVISNQLVIFFEFLVMLKLFGFMTPRKKFNPKNALLL